MNTETIDKLFLELSQFTKATTKREADLTARLAEAEEKLDTTETTLRTLQAGVARRVYGVLYDDVRPNELILVTVDKLIARLAAAEERDDGRSE